MKIITNKFSSGSIAIFLGFILCGPTVAGSYEVGAAKGLMIASILHEKCTGKPPIENETKRQVNMLAAQGFSPKDIQTGFMEGMLYAESNYPGKTKPPKSECDAAIKMYKMSLKEL